MIDTDNNNMENREDFRFDTIDDFIDHHHNLCKSRHKSSTKETTNALKYGKIKLSPQQKEMIDFVDKLWAGRPCSGAVILGPATSGKTFAIATILWKQRAKGIQLLICPSRNLVSMNQIPSYYLCNFS